MPDPVFTADWHSQNIPALTEVLAKFKGKPDIRALEIGCFEGRGTLWLLENILTGKDSWIHCIDTFAGSAEHEYFGMPFTDVHQRFRNNVPNDRMTLAHAPSGLALRLLRRQNDIIYVDGSHMAPDVLTDLVLSWPLLKKGGVMFMDDFEWPGTGGNPIHTPKPAISAFLEIYSEQLKVLYRGYSVAIEKV